MKKSIFIGASLALQISFNSSGILFAQVNFNSEEELLNGAHNFYVANQYTEAASLYAQLLSNHPENSSFNYYYGVSLLFSSKNKTEAIKHLEFASSFKEVPSLVYFYLAKAYHLNYQFDKAITQFEIFKRFSNSNDKEFRVDNLIEMCRVAVAYDFENSKNLILSQTETDDKNFINQYIFNNNTGRFLVMTDKFIKEKSNKDKYSKYVFLSASGDWLVYSGPGKSNTIGLFIAQRKSANDWKPAELLKFTVDSKVDKINPTISDDGETIYFSSVCAKSIGGFDIFKSTLDIKFNNWSEPENIGVPANSPEDDFYYVDSKEENIAYAYSKRDCETQKVNVVKIKLTGWMTPLPVIAKNDSSEIGTIEKSEINEQK